MKIQHPLLLVAAATWLLLSARPVRAVEYLTNGGFESGLTGWQTATTPTGAQFLQAWASTTAPTGYQIPGPQSGSFFALFDPNGRNAEVLFQDFTAPAGGPGTLTLSMFILNRHTGYINGPPNFSIIEGVQNQQLRIDVLSPNASVFSTQASDLYASFYQSVPGNTLLTGYQSFTFDLGPVFAAHPGEVLRLRFGHVVTELYMQWGIDNVSVTNLPNNVPEPSTWCLAVLGVAVAAGVLRCRGVQPA